MYIPGLLKVGSYLCAGFLYSPPVFGLVLVNHNRPVYNSLFYSDFFIFCIVIRVTTNLSRSFLLIVALALVIVPLAAQTLADEKERQLKAAAGTERLELLNWLSLHYASSNEKRAFRFARQGDQLANNLLQSKKELSVEQRVVLMSMKETYGVLQYNRGKYIDAKDAFEVALSQDPKTDSIMATVAVRYLSKIDSLAAKGQLKDSPFNRFFRDLDVGAAINNSKNDVAASTELQVAKMAEKRGDTTMAISHYQRAANILRNNGDIEEAEQVEEKIATFERLRVLSEQVALPSYDTVNRVELPPLVAAKEKTDIATIKRQDPIERTENALGNEIKYGKTRNYYEAYLSLQSKAEEDSLLQVMLIDQARSEMERLQQQNEIADLNIEAIQREKDAQERQKNSLIVIAAGVVVATLIILFLYITKRKKHNKLTSAYEDLAEAKGELEVAERRISKLLEQQVSPEIASVLLDERTEHKRHIVTIMFLDIRDFTPMASAMEPDQLIDFQNAIFGFMIEIINECHGNINQFMGDGFMATFGAPRSHGNDAHNAMIASRRILARLDELNAEGEVPWTRVGIGLHTGDVVAGNVGTEHRKQFSVTGETVIIAARVEQLNKKYNSRLILTREVANELLSGSEAHDDWQENDFEELSVTVKGRKEPVKILVYQEVGVKTHEKTVSSGEVTESPMPSPAKN